MSLYHVPRSELAVIAAEAASDGVVPLLQSRLHRVRTDLLVLVVRYARATRYFVIPRTSFARLESPLTPEQLKPFRIRHTEAIQPRSPAVVLADGDIAGVWMQVPERRRPIRSRPRTGRSWSATDNARGVTRSRTHDDNNTQVFLAGRDIIASLARPPRVPRSETPPLRRTPHLDAPDRLPTRRGERFTVSAWLDAAAARPQEQSDEVVVELPAGTDAVELTALAVTSPHFAPAGSHTRPLLIERDSVDSDPVSFLLEVADPDAAGPAEVIVQFMHGSRPCGRVLRRWSWPDGRTQTTPAGSAALAVHVGAAAPALTVSITKVGSSYVCNVIAPEIDGFRGWSGQEEWALADGAAALVAARLSPLHAGDDPERRRRALLAAGIDFWKAAPTCAQKAIWALLDARRDGDPPPPLYIASDEPLLPWEVMLPTRPRPGRGDEERPLPLGVETAIGRWVRGSDRTPAPIVPISDSFLIAPSYPGESALDASAEEAVLRRSFGGSTAPTTLAELDAFLCTRSSSLLHFACHGVADDADAYIYLDDHTRVSSNDVRASRGFRRMCDERMPVIFLNACRAGRSASALGPGGVGFPRVFCELGARAIVAPLWPVTDRHAAIVARTLYEAAVSLPDRPLATVLGELRRRSYEDAEFDDSWAAYCLFGDPCSGLA